MMIVAQKHIIKRTKFFGTDSRAGELSQRDRTGVVLASPWIECWISQQTHTAEFQQASWSANISNSN